MPIIPRLQRMFHCKSLAQLMDWHVKNRSKDGFMRIPADSKAMKHIEDKWPRKFKDEPCSIRLGLAMKHFSFYVNSLVNIMKMVHEYGMNPVQHIL